MDEVTTERTLILPSAVKFHGFGCAAAQIVTGMFAWHFLPWWGAVLAGWIGGSVLYVAGLCLICLCLPMAERGVDKDTTDVN
ncbi:hypothetical protein K2Q16_00520 [Patescibacteria group bacterium]|nr:hypothetical protein [Patescibacteria group bacterium]